MADWEKIKDEYEGGEMTPSEIGAKHGFTKSYINQKAKKLGWVRDRSTAVRRRARAIAALDDTKGKKEQERVEEAAEKAVNIIRAHKKTLRRLSDIVERVSVILEVRLKRVEEQLSKFPHLSVVTAMREVTELTDQLSRSVTRLVELERKTYALDEPETPDAEQQRVQGVISEARTIEQRVIDIRAALGGGAIPGNAGATRHLPADAQSA